MLHLFDGSPFPKTDSPQFHSIHHKQPLLSKSSTEFKNNGPPSNQPTKLQNKQCSPETFKQFAGKIKQLELKKQ